MTGALRLEFQRSEADWPETVFSRCAEIADAIAHVIELDDGDASATVMMATDARVQELNAQFRAKDAPTNVLSFPNAEHPDTPETDGRYLGDVILAAETIAREAVAQSKSIEHHTVHLIVHGILHLFGYDHGTDAEGEAMERVEIRVLERLGVPDPYSEELSRS